MFNFLHQFVIVRIKKNQEKLKKKWLKRINLFSLNKLIQNNNNEINHLYNKVFIFELDKTR